MRAQAYPMPTHQFEMAPLDEFVVTERKYPNRVALPRVHIDTWLFSGEWGNDPANRPQYDYVDSEMRMYINAKQPDDCEVYQNSYELVFDPSHFN